MYWTLELASKLEDAPWPASKDELIDYAMMKKYLKVLKIFGRTIRVKMTFSSTKTSTNLFR